MTSIKWFFAHTAATVSGLAVLGIGLALVFSPIIIGLIPTE